jgi:hypothetical protein
LGAPTTATIEDSKNRLKAGCSVRAVAVSPGRDNKPVVASVETGFPRDEVTDGSSFFIVRPFPSRLDFEGRYYDLG